MTSEADDLIVETMDRIFSAADLELPGSQSKLDSLWASLEETGLSRTWIAEEFGGAGASLLDGFAVARVAGRHAAPVPLVENLLAGWVLSAAMQTLPAGRMTFAQIDAAGVTVAAKGQLASISASAYAVPYASAVDHLVVVAESEAGANLACLARDQFELSAGENIAGEPAENVHINAQGVNVLHIDKHTASFIELVGVTLRAQQISGALERSLSLSLQYSRVREQFGRPISKFQAVQHNLAVLAGEVAAASAAADAAAQAIAHGVSATDALLPVAAAKIRCADAATKGAAIAHQVHGAIGFAKEYPLHLYTRRLMAWRDDFGSEMQWAERLGQAVAGKGADEFWPYITQPIATQV